MMSTMSRTDLVISLQSMLMDSADRFDDPDDFDRQLNAAAADLSRVRPRVISAELTLIADECFYTAPTDLIVPIALDWGTNELRSRLPWNTNWLGRIPRIRALTTSGVKKLMLIPAPTAYQISELGQTASYRYSAVYVIGSEAADTTVEEKDRPLLLLRALAEAMQDLASRGVSKPVTLGGKAGLSVPKNGAPSVLAEQLLKRFEAMAQ
jgi:hypothetical protein